MENHVGDSVEYFLSLNRSLKSALYTLRYLTHLKLASDMDNDLIWVRGFLEPEIQSKEVLSLPSVQRFYLKDTKLYVVGKKLPYCIEPSLLWTPIQRGLSVQLPKQNFNYFGIEFQHNISLIPSVNEQAVNVLICSMDNLRKYANTAASARLDPLMWTMYDIDKAIVMGVPVLPIVSEDYYKVGCFLVPAGYKIKYDNMVSFYKDAIEDSEKYWFLLEETNGIKRIPRNNFTQLSKGSIERTVQSLKSKLTNQF